MTQRESYVLYIFHICFCDNMQLVANLLLGGYSSVKKILSQGFLSTTQWLHIQMLKRETADAQIPKQRVT